LPASLLVFSASLPFFAGIVTGFLGIVTGFLGIVAGFLGIVTGFFGIVTGFFGTVAAFFGVEALDSCRKRWNRGSNPRPRLFPGPRPPCCRLLDTAILRTCSSARPWTIRARPSSRS
jgi:hypothetical protein